MAGIWENALSSDPLLLDSTTAAQANQPESLSPPFIYLSLLEDLDLGVTKSARAA
jgi:hypothetical protein